MSISENFMEDLESPEEIKMQKFKSQLKDVLEEANDLDIAYDDDDMISQMSMRIPVLNTTAAMKFVDKEV